ncbi:alpha/beta fold hydrolase [Nocardia abscessus]|uniref:alpha/beta fold hydrolase n=1 Tax=Nocardia abscessus TaxID=120957 RepID=UPI0018933E4A|nr:alpha/beta hydrolase [Nocardia abscessus]MBF6339936.1 alpha/beta fold hydrolase [Nocardia abscessus]
MRGAAEFPDLTPCRRVHPRADPPASPPRPRSSRCAAATERGCTSRCTARPTHRRSCSPTACCAHSSSGATRSKTFAANSGSSPTTSAATARSEAPRAGHYGIEHLADDLHAVLTATVPGNQRAVIAGHSLGGIAVMAWAARHPDEVTARAAAVALVNTTPGVILDHMHVLRGPDRLLGVRRRLARTVVPLAGIPLPRRMPLRRRLLTHVAVGRAAGATVGSGLDRMVATTSARGRGGYGSLLVNLLTALDPAALNVPASVIAGRAGPHRTTGTVPPDRVPAPAVAATARTGLRALRTARMRRCRVHGPARTRARSRSGGRAPECVTATRTGAKGEPRATSRRIRTASPRTGSIID